MDKKGKMGIWVGLACNMNRTNFLPQQILFQPWTLNESTSTIFTENIQPELE